MSLVISALGEAKDDAEGAGESLEVVDWLRGACERAVRREVTV